MDVIKDCKKKKKGKFSLKLGSFLLEDIPSSVMLKFCQDNKDRVEHQLTTLKQDHKMMKRDLDNIKNKIVDLYNLTHEKKLNRDDLLQNTEKREKIGKDTDPDINKLVSDFEQEINEDKGQN